MRRLWMICGTLALIWTLLSSCVVSQDPAQGEPKALKEPESQESELVSNVDSKGQAVDLSALEWKSDDIIATLAMPFYSASKDGTPEGCELPEEIVTFFQTEYGTYFELDSIYPLLGYEVDRYDFNGDGVEDYVVRGYPNMGGQLLPDVYLFLAQPEDEYQRILLGLEKDKKVRILDSKTDGVPDILCGCEGNRMVYNGGNGYISAMDPVIGDNEYSDNAFLVSKPEFKGNTVQIPLTLKWVMPEGCYAAVYFKTDQDCFVEPYGLITLPGELEPVDVGQANTISFSVMLQLNPDVQLPGGCYFFPDEIQYIPIP